MLMLHRATVLIALVSVFPTFAAAEDPAGLDEVLSQWAKQGREVRSVRANFVRSHHTQLMRKPLICKGRFYWTPEAMRWQTIEPEASEMIIKDRLVEMYYPDLKLLERYRLREQDMFWSSLPGVTMSVDRIRADYEITIEPAEAGDDRASAAEAPTRREDAATPTVDAEQDSTPGFPDRIAQRVVVRLTPRQPRIAEHIRLIRLWRAKDRAMPERVEYLERSGDVISIEFEEVELNAELDDAAFTLSLPEDVEINEPLVSEPSTTPGV